MWFRCLLMELLKHAAAVLWYRSTRTQPGLHPIYQTTVKRSFFETDLYTTGDKGEEPCEDGHSPANSNLRSCASSPLEPNAQPSSAENISSPTVSLPAGAESTQ